MKLLLDEQISGRVADRLRSSGHDVQAVIQNPDLRGRPDEGVFFAAHGEGRAVVTYDRDDFLALATAHTQRGGEHAGLIIIGHSKLPSRDVTLLVKTLDGFLRSFKPWPSFVAWLP